MRGRRWFAVALVAASVGGTAGAAQAKPKPWKQTYEVFLPQPWVVASHGMGDCSSAPDGLSKSSWNVAVPAQGKLSAGLSDYVGDWMVVVTDAKGTVLASAHGTGGGQLVTVKHKRGRQAYRVAVCNWAGGPHGTVTLAYTPS